MALGLSFAALAQAHAESGEGTSVYRAAPQPAEQTALAEDAPVSPLPVEAEAPAPEVRKRSAGAASDAKKAIALKPLVVRYAVENGVPYELADAVIRLESRYNALARNGVNVGLTQINTRTAQAMGYQGATEGLLDAETNLRYGLKYLAQAYRLADGDTCGTILRYQAGHRAQSMTAAARAYCAKVQTILAVAD
jgi:soluble lytic murein transglycosylase-like protein